MKRRDFLAKLGIGVMGMTIGQAAVGFEAGNGSGASGRKAPNFLFILTDQQRWDALGASGNKLMHTPNLDSLAASGVRFDNCYVAQAVCSPSRASILSGLYPHAHGVEDNIYGVDDVTSSPEYNMGVTWPGILQKNGYRTCWIGKWHLGEKAPKCFDEWHGFNSLLSHWMGEPHKSEYRSDAETEIGLEFLERNKDRPFVLCQSYYPPHTPYTAPKKYWKHYEGTQLEPMEYYAAVSDIDANIGRLIDKLKELDLLDNTFIIFTSDHGDHFGKRPGGANKRAAYDDCARVPLIINHPRMAKGGTVRKELVSSVDLMPTILDVAGIEAPNNLHGRSLVPLLQSKKVPWRSCVTVQNHESSGSEDGKAGDICHSRGVRTKDKKLILRDRLSVRASSLREFYDLTDDPREQSNIYGNGYSKEVLSVIDCLDRWAHQTGDKQALDLTAACRSDLASAPSTKP